MIHTYLTYDWESLQVTSESERELKGNGPVITRTNK